MRNRLFIRFAPLMPGNGEDISPGEISWVRMQGTEPLGSVTRGLLEEEAAALAGGGYQIIVLVPGADVLLTQAAVPTQNRQRLARALPFALEERLGSEVEDLHFALGRRQEDNQISAAVVDRARMDTWLAGLREAGLQPDIVSPETLALPSKPGTWLVLKENIGTMVRTGPQSGFAADSDNLDILLNMALDEAEAARPTQVHLLDCTPDSTALPETTTAHPDIGIAIEACDEEPLALLAKSFDEQNAINLLQGDYSRGEQLGKLWRPWRPALALVMVWLLVQVGTMVTEANRLSRKAPRLQQQVEQIYRKTFPDARKVVNPRVQMERALEALRSNKGQGGEGFLKVLASSGPSLQEAPNLHLRNVSYKDGELNLDLEIQDLQALDQLKQRLGGQSELEVEIQSASSLADKVESRLQVRPKKP